MFVKYVPGVVIIAAIIPTHVDVLAETESRDCFVIIHIHKE